MIKKITKSDRRKNPKGTKGKKYKLVSKETGRVLGYGKTVGDMEKREMAVQYFKNK